MPRKRIPVVANEPYHITARCINKEWFKLPLEVVWSIMEDHLFLLNTGFNIRIHSFVLMSNHFHLLVTSPQGNLSAAMLYFMRETSKEITRLSGRINQTYGNRNYKTWIGSYHYFLNSYKYVYQNPLRAELCNSVQDYPYSTLHGLMGKSKLIIPIEESLVLNPLLDDSQIRWLNQKANPELNEEMRLALRRTKFQLPTCRRTMKQSRLENELL